ncbi:hypothetical protein [Alteromonas macleodii]|uniref:hypothetical protein n=1 Tax=Alteromonas macleodii TaxID=28108 RepID=UPI000C78E6E1|nr:hypothetical protein [Alteromonas macleodii]AUI82457.1 hypothetical protein TE101_09240 [Alteromonas macleodii]
MTAKVKINLQEGLIELEGSEEFVNRQVDKLEAITTLFNQNKLEVNAGCETVQEELAEDNTNITVDSETKNPVQQEFEIPESFGEWMHKFRDDISDQEKALVASLYVQKNSSSNDFKTAEINNCLKEHGIKVSGLSTQIQRLANKKLTFQTRKVGKLIHMRVSKDGQDHLKTMLR